MKVKVTYVEREDKDYESKRLDIDFKCPKKTMKALENSINAIYSYFLVMKKL